MSETKSQTRRKKRLSSARIPKALSLNEMKYKTTWTATAVSSGTAGTMQSWTSPSIAHSSEYSVVSSLFTEVRLLRCTAIFGPIQSANGTIAHGTLIVGTNMLENESTGSTPAAFTDIQNLTRPVRISTLGVREYYYRVPVPKNLEFAALTADAPNPPTPWAGSPGAIKWFGSNVQPSTAFFTIHLEAVYHLRGRQ